MTRRMFTWFTAGALTAALGTALAVPATSAPADAPAAKAGDRASMGEPGGRHTVRGEVRAIDETRGVLTLRIGDGDFRWQLPAAALKGIKKGDRLSVRLAVDSGGASGQKPGGPGGKGSGAPRPEEPGRGAGTSRMP